MNIVKMFDVIKNVAKDSGLVNDVRLIKSGENVENAVLTKGYRKLLITASRASLYKEDNDIVFHLMVLDKTDEDDTLYLHSINDGIALIRMIIDSVSKVYHNRANVTQLEISSGKDEDSLMTSIECDISLEFNIID